MATYSKAPAEIIILAAEIIGSVEDHTPLIDTVRIDWVFAHGDQDDEGNVINHALKHHGLRALGVCRVVNLKDRAKGMGDVEVCIDADWWAEADDAQQRALLDHELTHIRVMNDVDALRRPKIKMRKHDFEVGWFASVAQRHGDASGEIQQAKQVVAQFGQQFFPWMESKPHGDSVESAVKQFRNIVKNAGATVTIK